MASTCSYFKSALSTSCQLAHPKGQLEGADDGCLRESCTQRAGSRIACLKGISAGTTRREKRLRTRYAARSSSKSYVQVKASEDIAPSAAAENAEGSKQHSKGQGLNAAVDTCTAPQEALSSIHRRQALFAISFLVTSFAQRNSAHAADTSAPAKEESPLDSIASFLDPDELAASGRKIPKAYKKQVREVVRTLKESLADQQAKDFRRKADPAKEAIRGYIVNWRGAASVQSEVSYTALERVLRALGAFYSKAGPNARVTDELREEIFKDLDLAENSL